ncbi:MAG TPA: VOC family protein [Pyrinomonadaceae bacterium]|nr:VOC family protein [Pyrinomonadaceae bacterium]
MPRVIHFELSADDPERAVKFYDEVFGWKTQKWDGPQSYWLLETGDEGQPGINGGLMKRADNPLPPFSTINTIDVPSVDDYTQKIEERGGKVVMPKGAVQGIGYIAYCEDTEGNIFGIMQFDPSAK